MSATHQQITDETGQTFVIVPLEEYKALYGEHPPETELLDLEEQNAIREGMADITNGDSFSAEDVANQLGLALKVTTS